jgi:hypothetical protein
MQPLNRLTMLALLGLALAGCGSDPARSSSVSDHHWALNEIQSDTTVIITGYIGSSSCDSFDEVTVDENDSSVDIRVRVRSNGAEACTADMRMQEFTVELSAPLGIRELIGCMPIEITPGVTDPEGCRRIETRLPR